MERIDCCGQGRHVEERREEGPFEAGDDLPGWTFRWIHYPSQTKKIFSGPNGRRAQSRLEALRQHRSMFPRSNEDVPHITPPVQRRPQTLAVADMATAKRPRFNDDRFFWPGCDQIARAGPLRMQWGLPAPTCQSPTWMPVNHLLRILGDSEVPSSATAHGMFGTSNASITVNGATVMRLAAAANTAARSTSVSVAPGLTISRIPATARQTEVGSAAAADGALVAPSSISECARVQEKVEDLWERQLAKLESQIGSCNEKLKIAEEQLQRMRPEENEHVMALRSDLADRDQFFKASLDNIDGRIWRSLDKIKEHSDTISMKVSSLKNQSLAKPEVLEYQDVSRFSDEVWNTLDQLREHSSSIKQIEDVLLGAKSDRRQVEGELLQTKDRFARLIDEASVSSETKDLKVYCNKLRMERETLLATRSELVRVSNVRS